MKEPEELEIDRIKTTYTMIQKNKHTEEIGDIEIQISGMNRKALMFLYEAIKSKDKNIFNLKRKS